MTITYYVTMFLIKLLTVFIIILIRKVNSLKGQIDSLKSQSTNAKPSIVSPNGKVYR